MKMFSPAPNRSWNLEATKFDDANVSHDVELKINPLKGLEKAVENLVIHVPAVNLPIWSKLQRIIKGIDAKPEAKKTKRYRLIS